MKLKIGDLVRLTKEGVDELKIYNPKANTRSIYKVVETDDDAWEVVIDLKNMLYNFSYLFVSSNHCVKVSLAVKLNRKLLL